MQEKQSGYLSRKITVKPIEKKSKLPRRRLWIVMGGLLVLVGVYWFQTKVQSSVIEMSDIAELAKQAGVELTISYQLEQQDKERIIGVEMMKAEMQHQAKLEQATSSIINEVYYLVNSTPEDRAIGELIRITTYGQDGKIEDVKKRYQAMCALGAIYKKNFNTEESCKWYGQAMRIGEGIGDFDGKDAYNSIPCNKS